MRRDAESIARRVSNAVTAAGQAIGGGPSERAVKEAIRAEMRDLSDTARARVVEMFRWAIDAIEELRREALS